jgi:HEAT repeat protein
MKAFITPILISLTVLQLVTVGCTKHHETTSAIQNRPEDALVRDVKIGGFPTDPNPGLDALISKGPRVMPDLARLLQSDGSRDERIKAADAMGAIAYHNPNAPEVQDTIPVLMTAAKKGDSEVRFRAVQALGAIGQGASNAAPVLIQLTRDTNSSVRMCAVEALGQIGADSPESLAALKVSLSDTSDDVRVTAKQALEIVQRGHK